MFSARQESCSFHHLIKEMILPPLPLEYPKINAVHRELRQKRQENHRRIIMQELARSFSSAFVSKSASRAICFWKINGDSFSTNVLLIWKNFNRSSVSNLWPDEISGRFRGESTSLHTGNWACSSRPLKSLNEKVLWLQMKCLQFEGGLLTGMIDAWRAKKALLNSWRQYEQRDKWNYRIKPYRFHSWQQVLWVTHEHDGDRQQFYTRHISHTMTTQR